MFFKRNKNQENDCDVYQGKHDVTTKYFVKLDDGQFVAKNWYDDAVSQGTGKYWMYSMDKLEDAKRVQREYGGTIYEEVEETYFRPYVSDKVPSQHQCVVIGKDDTWVTMNDKIKQLINDGTPKPHVEADMTTDARLDDELAKHINELKDVSHGTPHIQIDIPTINEYPRVYVDGENLTDSTNRAVQKLLLNYNTGTAVSNPSQNIDVQYIEKNVKNDWSVKHYTESALDYKDDSELPKSHVNADMAVNVKLDTADAIKSINDLKEALNGITDHPKIHELPKNDQFSGLNVGDHIFAYSFVTANSKTIELLKQPNTRLAIIEDDEDA